MRRVTQTSLAMLACYVTFFCWRANLDMASSLMQEVTERFWMQTNLVWTILLAMGCKLLYVRCVWWGMMVCNTRWLQEIYSSSNILSWSSTSIYLAGLFVWLNVSYQRAWTRDFLFLPPNLNSCNTGWWIACSKASFCCQVDQAGIWTVVTLLRDQRSANWATLTHREESLGNTDVKNNSTL